LQDHPGHRQRQDQSGGQDDSQSSRVGADKIFLGAPDEAGLVEEETEFEKVGLYPTESGAERGGIESEAEHQGREQAGGHTRDNQKGQSI